MATVHVTAKRDFLESLATALPLPALAELIWNGFDAQSNVVQVHLDMNALGGLETIRVRDYGHGINRAHVESLFGNLGESWKKIKARQNGRALHGKNGKGRFKAFALGTLVEWNTTALGEDGQARTYRITGRASTLDDFDIYDSAESVGATPGTEVVISNLKQNFRSLTDDSAPLEIAKLFAAYLTQYPGLRLEFNGTVIDPQSAQVHHGDYPLGDVELGGGRKTPVAVSVIEWAGAAKRAIHLCDANGIGLGEVPVGSLIRAPGFEFTAYVKCDHFRELDKDNQLVLAELNPDLAAILAPARAQIKEHFRRRLAEDQSRIVERWKQQRVYPYEDKPSLTPIETAERQIFDILAANVESYLPTFDDADTKSRRFTFRLLAQAIRDNPNSVQQVIGDALGLRKEAQDELSELLRETPLSSIISSAKTVADRLDFLTGFEAVVLAETTRKKRLDPDQLYQLLDKEAWLFDEYFSLAGSEQRLEEVLAKHLAALGKHVDLIFQKAVQPRTGEFDYLIVASKRPSRKNDAEVLNQIEAYAKAVASDERFSGVPARWSIIAVSEDLDESVKSKLGQNNRSRGQVIDDSVLNLTICVRTWSELIGDAKSRLRFVTEQLTPEADSDIVKAHLKKAHAKFIPNLDSPVTTLNASPAETGSTPPESVQP